MPNNQDLNELFNEAVGNDMKSKEETYNPNTTSNNNFNPNPPIIDDEDNFENFYEDEGPYLSKVSEKDTNIDLLASTAKEYFKFRGKTQIEIDVFKKGTGTDFNILMLRFNKVAVGLLLTNETVKDQSFSEALAGLTNQYGNPGSEGVNDISQRVLSDLLSAESYATIKGFYSSRGMGDIKLGQVVTLQNKVQLDINPETGKVRYEPIEPLLSFIFNILISTITQDEKPFNIPRMEAHTRKTSKGKAEVLVEAITTVVPKQVVLDPINNIYFREDRSVSVNVLTKANRGSNFNIKSAQGTYPVGRVGVYTDLLLSKEEYRERVKSPEGYNESLFTRVKALPHHIITYVDAYKHRNGYILLPILLAIPGIKSDWMRSYLSETDNTLNAKLVPFFDYVKNNGQIPPQKPMKDHLLLSKDLTIEDKAAAFSEIIDPAVMISIDLEIGTVQSAHMKDFLESVGISFGKELTGDDIKKANLKILTALYDIFNIPRAERKYIKIFEPKFKLLAKTHIVDAKGNEADGRVIDGLTIFNHLLKKGINPGMSMRGNGYTELNTHYIRFIKTTSLMGQNSPEEEKSNTFYNIALTSSYAQDGKVTGRIVRLTFTGSFINKLQSLVELNKFRVVGSGNKLNLATKDQLGLMSYKTEAQLSPSLNNWGKIQNDNQSTRFGEYRVPTKGIDPFGRSL